MKHLFSPFPFLLIFAFVVLSCTKDDDKSVAVVASSPRLSQVRCVSQQITNKYDYYDALLSSDTVSSDFVSQRWSWDGQSLASIEYNDASGLLYVNDYVYQQGRVQSFQQRGTNVVTFYRYSNNRLDSIVTYNGTALSTCADFVYASDADQYPEYVLFSRGEAKPSKYILTWNDGNMTSYVWNYDETTATSEQYAFDNHFNPFYHVESNINVANLSQHNYIAKDYAFSTQYGDTRTHTDYHYLYEGNKPVSMSYTDTSKIGRTVNIYNYQYYYTYLSD